MSGDNNNLVNDIMQQLEQQNGSYNEDIGEFSNKASGGGGSQVMNNLQQKFLSIIGENQGLKELISSNPKYQQTINDILGHEELLKDLLNDPSITPAVITSILNQGGDDDEEESPLPSMEMPNKAQGVMKRPGAPRVAKLEPGQNGSLSSSIPDININPNLNASSGAEATNAFSWSEFLSGPLIAVVCFFLVTNTPLIYYLGQVPYIGELLVSNKLIVSMLLIGVLYIVFSVLLDFSGLV